MRKHQSKYTPTGKYMWAESHRGVNQLLCSEASRSKNLNAIKQVGIFFPRAAAAHLMSTSLKVVNMAQVFCASFSLWAILSLIRFIFSWTGEQNIC